jgi:hypothetical protein
MFILRWIFRTLLFALAGRVLTRFLPKMRWLWRLIFR